MSDNRPIVPRQTVLPPDGYELRMPSGTPLGIGFLGAARFAAIKRVFDQMERAYRAVGHAVDARSEVNDAMVRHAASLEQLNHLDTIRGDVATRIIKGAEVNRLLLENQALRLRLDQMELEDQFAAKELARAKARAPAESASTASATPSTAPKPDDFAVFIRDLQRMPDVAKAAAAVKEQIIKDAGGETNLNEAGRQMVEMIDAMMTAFVQKKAEDRML